MGHRRGNSWVQGLLWSPLWTSQGQTLPETSTVRGPFPLLSWFPHPLRLAQRSSLRKLRAPQSLSLALPLGNPTGDKAFEFAVSFAKNITGPALYGLFTSQFKCVTCTVVFPDHYPRSPLSQPSFITCCVPTSSEN